MPLKSGVRLGPYTILEPLGAGGMGEVYRAHDRKLQRAVAGKVLPEHLAADATAKARFAREARSIAALASSGAPWKSIPKIRSPRCTWGFAGSWKVGTSRRWRSPRP